MAVRPKGHYEVGVTVKEAILYMKEYSVYFVDIDQFLLFFTAKGYTYYPL